MPKITLTPYIDQLKKLELDLFELSSEDSSDEESLFYRKLSMQAKDLRQTITIKRNNLFNEADQHQHYPVFKLEDF